MRNDQFEEINKYLADNQVNVEDLAELEDMVTPLCDGGGCSCTGGCNC